MYLVLMARTSVFFMARTSVFMARTRVLGLCQLFLVIGQVFLV